jgi:hypothetical protein
VYRYKAYDINTDSTTIRTRMGTRKAIAGIKRATITESSGIKIHERRPNPNMNGFTAANFVP